MFLPLLSISLPFFVAAAAAAAVAVVVAAMSRTLPVMRLATADRRLSPSPPALADASSIKRGEEEGERRSEGIALLEIRVLVRRDSAETRIKVRLLSLSLSLCCGACAREARFILRRKYTDRPSELARNILTVADGVSFSRRLRRQEEPTAVRR